MPHPAPVVFADFLDDGRIVTVGQDGILRFWDGNFEQEGRFAGHRGRIIATAIDRKGDRMATASLDGTVILWDTRYEGRDVDTQGDPPRSPCWAVATSASSRWTTMALCVLGTQRTTRRS